MSGGGDYELVVTPPAQRAIAEQLPEPVAAAVVEFLTTSLIHDPRRVGKQLRRELAGIWSARRGTYRVLYRIREDPREVIILRQTTNKLRPREARRDIHGGSARRLHRQATTRTRRSGRPVRRDRVFDDLSFHDQSG